MYIYCDTWKVEYEDGCLNGFFFVRESGEIVNESIQRMRNLDITFDSRLMTLNWQARSLDRT